jgi:protein TonB
MTHRYRLLRSITCLALVTAAGAASFADETEERFSLPPVEVTAPWPLTPPEIARLSKPVYPEPARRRGERGTVELRVKVLPDGEVGEVTVNKSSGFRSLDDAAVAEARKWQFVPAMRGPRAAEAWVEVPVRFELVE